MRWLMVVFFLLPGTVAANDWAALDQPGAVAIMRHALAPGTGDPPTLRVGDCTTQRNLDERGRAQARAIGEAFRERGIDFDKVLSPANGAEQARPRNCWGLARSSRNAALNSFFQDFSTRDSQTADARALLEREQGRLMLVTHQVNISALTGRATRSGEVLVIRAGDQGVGSSRQHPDSTMNIQPAVCLDNEQQDFTVGRTGGGRMTQTIELPLWVIVIASIFAMIAIADRLLSPAVRWFFRRRVNQAIDELNTRLQLKIRPFGTTRRERSDRQGHQ
jgi:phosphohistidine phosphatase SixA